MRVEYELYRAGRVRTAALHAEHEREGAELIKKLLDAWQSDGYTYYNR